MSIHSSLASRGSLEDSDPVTRDAILRSIKIGRSPNRSARSPCNQFPRQHRFWRTRKLASSYDSSKSRSGLEHPCYIIEHCSQEIIKKDLDDSCNEIGVSPRESEQSDDVNTPLGPKPYVVLVTMLC